MNQYNKDNFENLLIYNNIYYNLLKNRIHENEILIFIEDIININDSLIYPLTTQDLLYNELDIKPYQIIINITGNKQTNQEIYKKLGYIFLSYGYNYNISNDMNKQRYLIIEF